MSRWRERLSSRGRRGPYGYQAFLKAIADPKDTEHDDVLAWVGGSFDPFRFDLAEANAALQQIR